LPEFRVRAIRRGDRERWAPLWRAYLTFYGVAENPEVTSATWARIFDPLEPVHAVVAERDRALVGFPTTCFSAAPGSSTRNAICRTSMSGETNAARASAGR
jgi:hypothetical protein